MGIVSEVVGSMAASATEKTQTKKNDSLGKTTGEPTLSDGAKIPLHDFRRSMYIQYN